MSDQSKLDAVAAVLDTLDATALRETEQTERRTNAAYFVETLERRGYQILPFAPNHPYDPDKQRRRDAGLSTSDRPTNVTRIGLRGTTTWVAIGDYDGYFRAVVQSYADDQTEYVASCSHRHVSKSRALICADRMVRVRARRAERLAATALHRGG